MPKDTGKTSSLGLEKGKKGGCRTAKLNDQAGWSNLLITDIGDSNMERTRGFRLAWDVFTSVVEFRVWPREMAYKAT